MFVEKKMLRDDLSNELKNLISFDNSFPPGQTSDISKYIYEILSSCGFKVNLFENEKGLVNVVAEMGQGNPSIVFNTHIDTVGPGKIENWYHDPFDAKLDAEKLSGLGAVNCKGSGAVQIWLAKQIAKKGGPAKGKVSFTFVTDEENLGPNGTAYLREIGAIKPDILILGAPTNNDLIIEERGVLWIEIITTGKSAHAGEPHLGENAIVRMIRICNHLEREMAKKLKQRKISGMKSTINIGKIEGGVNTNVVPNLCRLEIDRRLLPKEDKDEAFNEMKTVFDSCEEARENASIKKIRGTNGFSGEKSYLIVQKISESYEEILGNQIEFINSIGVSDGRYFSGDEIEIVCFGPGKDSEGHSVNESIEIKSMLDSALILEKSISKILGYKNN